MGNWLHTRIVLLLRLIQFETDQFARRTGSLSMVTELQATQLSPERPLWRYEDLLRATAAISGCHDMETFRERFAEELHRVIDFDYVLVILFDPETHKVQRRMFHAPGYDAVQLPELEPQETPSSWVYEHQAPMVIRDWRREDRYPRLRDYFKHYDIRSD